MNEPRLSRLLPDVRNERLPVELYMVVLVFEDMYLYSNDTYPLTEISTKLDIPVFILETYINP